MNELKWKCHAEDIYKDHKQIQLVLIRAELASYTYAVAYTV